MNGCPDPAVLDAFCRGTLAPADREAFERHMDGCGDCSRTVGELLRLYGSASWGNSLPGSSEPTLGGASRSLDDTAYGGGTPPWSGSSPVTVGRYQLGRRLGAGGMGMVFEAHDPELHRLVAIKLLHPGVGGDAEGVRARLLREARAMAKLAHPNVVAVHDVGGVGEQVFVAMELVPGTTLTRWQRDAPRTQGQIIATYVQAGRGLQAAHAVGLVHRDFKPDNVLIGMDGRARVTDFGLARPSLSWPAVDGAGEGAVHPIASGLTIEAATAHGALVGTPAYMSPEQWRGVPADARSDQFAFCVALYEALFGERPFRGGSVFELADNVMAGRASPVPRTAPGWLRAALTQGMAVDPEQRHPSMTELLEALERDRGRGRRIAAIAGAMGVGALATVGVLRWMAGSAEATPQAPPAASAVEVPAQAEPAPKPTATATEAPPDDAAKACREQAKLADGRWTAARRSELLAQLSKMEHARELSAATMPGLDRWVQDYAAQAGRLCDAASPPAHADARRRCLQGGLARFDSLVARTLSVQTFKAQGAIAGATYELPSLRVCDDEAWLAVWPAPPPAEQAAKVQLLSGDLAAVEAQAWLELLVAAPPDAERLVKDAEALGYAPLLAEAQLVTGRLAAQRQQDDIARSWLEPAALTAQSAGHERALAWAAVALLEVQGARRLRLGEVERWERLAKGAVDRFGDPELAAALALTRGRVQQASGELTAAARTLEAALASHTATYGASHPELAHVHLALAEVVLALGDAEAARLHAEAARGMLIDTEGPADLDVAQAEALVGRILLSQGQLAEAEAAARRAQAIVPVSASLRHDYDRGRYVELLGDVLLAKGDVDAALAEYERAKIYLYDGPPRSEPFLRIGTLLIHQGRHREGLDALATARAQLEEDYGADDPRLLDPLHTIGLAQLAAAQLDDARATLERAVELADATQSFGPLEARMQIALAEVERAAGHDARALELLDDAHVPWTGAYELGHPRVTDEVLARADLAWGLGQTEYAARLYGSVHDRLAEQRGPADPATARAAARREPP